MQFFTIKTVVLGVMGLFLMGCDKEEKEVTEPFAYEQAKNYGTDPTSQEIIEFNDSEIGTEVINTIYSFGTPIGIKAEQRLPNGKYKPVNVAKLFNTSSPTGDYTKFRTPNPKAFRPMGKILIINDAVDTEPNLYAGGGRIEVDFSAIGTVLLKGIHVLDIEENEAGSTLELLDKAGNVIKTMPLPVTGALGATRLRVDTPGVAKLRVTFKSTEKRGGTGAIDVLEFNRE
ncbi:hypothetical protein [Pontibacter ruber]|uniref:Uncharacterized protein n=1 Tax=Pontibacter ruber TaxID=1343895 RepID=A0ABW5D0W9_9BACT|nr:hypothetical protein [Pontibacter ruber]